jgi:hypothetical protein
MALAKRIEAPCKLAIRYKKNCANFLLHFNFITANLHVHAMNSASMKRFFCDKINLSLSKNWRQPLEDGTHLFFLLFNLL